MHILSLSLDRSIQNLYVLSIPMALVAHPTRIYLIDHQGMHFKVTVTVLAATVEEWIRGVKQEFLDAAEVKCVGLDCEFTDAPQKVKQSTLPAHRRQHAAVL